MRLSLHQVAGSHDLRDFLRLPYRLHAEDSSWCPPLLRDERRMLDPRRNLAHRYCDSRLWLIRDRNGAALGRVAGIINRRYNELRGENVARFGQIEVVNDDRVAGMLLEAVVDWSARHGMERVIGPMGYTDQDPEGLLVHGFGEAPSIGTYQNAAYVPHLLERLGWKRYTDYVVYAIPVAARMPHVYSRVLSRVASRSRLRLVEFTRRDELKPFIAPILLLMNETFTGLIGYSPLDEQEIRGLGRQYLPVIDPRFVKVVFAGTTMVGFIIAMPDLSDGLRRANGRLLPFGWLWITRAASRARRLDFLLGAVRAGYRGRGVDVLLGDAIMASARAAGFDYVDSHHELETNTLVRAEMERIGGTVYKRFRLYQRAV